MVANKLSAAGTPLTPTAAAAAGGFSCNPDFNTAQVGVITRWTPVKNLTFSAEVGWFHLDQKMSGVVTLTPSAPKPTATYQYKDQDTAYMQVRVQRNF
jgi:Porin subfamily